MVYRIYVEKKEGFDYEAQALLSEVKEILGVEGVEEIRILGRYDVEDIDGEIFKRSVKTVFSEPQTDVAAEGAYGLAGARVFASEYLPGQFDQRADSAAQCIQLISFVARPVIRTAKVYAVYGKVPEAGLSAIKRYVINPAESREASLAIPVTLKTDHPVPAEAELLRGFLDLDERGLNAFAKRYAPAMDADDMKFCQDYFKTEKRDPTLTEIRMIDTYWSDRCRHTASLTTIDSVHFEDALLESAYGEYLAARQELGCKTPVSLKDIGTVAAELLKKRGLFEKLDESEEGGACTVKIKVEVDGAEEDWLLLFKNETHPTGTEPFGEAASCIGGAIQSALSGRGYVYSAMRVTGAADPLQPASGTVKDKLPQRKIVTAAAAGCSSYGNQIGLATGQVDEIYHEGYAEKRLETGAVIAATPAGNVRHETPAAGDKVILLGGRTGRDGRSVTNFNKQNACGAEVQKGNAPEGRKLQRLFRNKDAALLVKRCSAVGAGGLAVAVGGLANGLEINLDAVSEKYGGLNGTELALSESPERMAVVVEADRVEEFIYLAQKENLEATVVATVTESPRLVMSWKGKTVADVSRGFLGSNGAEKHISVKPAPMQDYHRTKFTSFTNEYEKLAGDLNVCSRRGLAERFDSTSGAGTVLMPFGGKYQLTPPQAMVHLVPVEKGHTDTVSYAAWGGNPYITEKSPYHGAYLAVVESVSKLIATGASFKDIYLSSREYFSKPDKDPARWGQPLAALLGAFKAQKELGTPAIGNGMNSSFESAGVPPTFVSFAFTTGKVREVVSPEFKAAGHKVVLLEPEYDENGLPVTQSLVQNFNTVTNLLRLKEAVSVYTPGYGGVAEGILKMCLGGQIGFRYSSALPLDTIFGYRYGAFIIELTEGADIGIPLGETCGREYISCGLEDIPLEYLEKRYEDKLEPVYACGAPAPQRKAVNVSYPYASSAMSSVKYARPKVLIPVFPGTNCEYDTAKAFADAGARPEIFVIRNRTQEDIVRSAEKFASLMRDSQIVFIPGGFSGGEPDSSGKFIAAFFRGERVKEEVTRLLEHRDGLMGGICNGFQALVKLGLVPYGKITDTDETPTLALNGIGRHQSRIVNVRVASVKSPWLAGVEVGDIISVPVSHGEGRFAASDELLKKLAESGQIMTQYVDLDGNASMDIHFNPSGSANAVEGILSPDGRVFGKMGHSERKGYGLYKNVPGEYDMKLFESAVRYFK